MRLHAIFAMSENRVIGREGKLPWHLPEDLKWFKKLTLGQPVLMGRKTAESLEKPLPKRRNLVLSRSDSILAGGFERLKSVAQVDALPLEGVVWVIGGAEIFRLLLPRIEEVYLSHVHGVHGGHFSACVRDRL
ncbi:MAG: dihydrofolate reductase [Verrucomicrobiales bacterium]